MDNSEPELVGTGVRAEKNSEPRLSRQRSIPDPNDLQADNKAHYNSNIREAGLAMDWVAKINTPKYFNKIFEAANAVATERDEDIIHILNAVENHGRSFANSLKDREYTLAMVEALSLIGDISKRRSIMEARNSNDKHNELFKKLLNKSNKYNLSEGEKRRFAFAGVNALFLADTVTHNIL